MDKELEIRQNLRSTMAVFYRSYGDQNSDEKNQLQGKTKPVDQTNRFIMQTLKRKTKGIILMNELWSDSFHQSVMGQSRLQNLISSYADERIMNITDRHRT